LPAPFKNAVFLFFFNFLGHGSVPVVPCAVNTQTIYCHATVRTKHTSGFSHTDAATLRHCISVTGNYTAAFWAMTHTRLQGTKIYKTGVWELQNFSYELFLGDFAQLRKVTISVVISVRPSVRIEQLGSPRWTDFHEI